MWREKPKKRIWPPMKKIIPTPMTLGQNGVLRYGHFSDFWSINGDRMDNLGLIDFKIGLYIKVTVNTG